MRSIQCIDVVLKSAFHYYKDQHVVQCGRSFFLSPRDVSELGDYYELFTGLFQSTVLGSSPFVNIDIAHKAFPCPLGVIDIIKDLQLRRFRVPIDLFNKIDEDVHDALYDHLKALRIAYEMPDNPLSKKVYKFAELAAPPSELVFEYQDRRITVLQYFKERNYNIKFPNMPCIKVGMPTKNICLPAELCSVQENQVGTSWIVFQLDSS